MKNPLTYIFWLIVIGGIINYYLNATYVTKQSEEQLKKAYAEYVKGETALSIGKRKQAFNEALKLYMELKLQYEPVLGNGVLYYNIGNSFFQLSEYPFAVLYYNKAAKLMPRNGKVEHNLNEALNKLGLKTKSKESEIKRIFFFYFYLSRPEKLQIFFGLSLISIAFASFFVWQKKKWIKQGAIFFSALAAIMLITLAYGFYIAPIEGIIIRSSPLYRDAGLQYARVEKDPVLSGKKVEVLDVMKGGKWLKVATPEGILGYVPSESIRII